MFFLFVVFVLVCCRLWGFFCFLLLFICLSSFSPLPFPSGEQMGLIESISHLFKGLAQPQAVTELCETKSWVGH